MPDQDYTAQVAALAHLPALRPNYKITDADQLAEANALLEDLTAKEKQIEKIKDDKYTPARKALDDLRSIFDIPLKNIKAIKDTIRAEAKRYLAAEEALRLAAARAEEERRNAEMRTLEAKREAAEAAGKSTAKLDAKMTAAALAPSLIPEPIAKPDGMNRFVKTTGKYRFVDKTGVISDTPDMSIIPLYLHLLDTAQLGAIARAPGNKPNIPGVDFFKE